ncbi:MAG: phosphoribosylglycinamide formyltransferase, partial [Gammaproteobacteria bacterium]
VVCVLSNRPDVLALERARKAGVPAHCVDHTEHGSREAFEAAMIDVLDAVRPDWIVMAGFMRILTPHFVRHYAGRMLNIHPSLLPKYPGLNTHARALEAGDRVAGASVHFVTEALDGGPVIMQAAVPVVRGDTPETLARRVLGQEHILYPEVVRRVCQGRICLENEQVILDGVPIDKPLRIENCLHQVA